MGGGGMGEQSISWQATTAPGLQIPQTQAPHYII